MVRAFYSSGLKMDNGNKEIRVLFISDLVGWGGSTHSLVNMISSLPSNITPTVLLSGKGEVYNALNDMGIECIVRKYVNDIVFTSWHPRSIFNNFIHLLKYIILNRVCVNKVSKKLKGKVDIVHSNTSAVSIGNAIASRIGAKHVWHIREFIDLFLNCKILGGRDSLKREIHSADSVICISHSLVSHWKLDGKKNVFVLWNAVRHKTDIVYNKVKSNYFLFCCGYLNDFKGADYATRVFCRSSLFNSYKLRFVGAYDEGYKMKLLSIAKEYGAESSLEFLGFQDESQIKVLMSNATAFLQCSLIEGLGRTVIEAMFYGCPVIARNNGGTVDFVSDGINGFLYDTEEECIEKIKYVASNDVSSMILKAQETAIEGFSIEDYGMKIERLYQDVLGS